MTYQVIVIGGGIMGVATLQQLAAHGWSNTLLLEKAELTSGSTWHAAGQIAHAVGSRLAGWINKESIAIYKQAERDTGQSIGWHEVGGFRLAYDDHEVDWLKSIMGVGKVLDLPMQLVGPEEVNRLNPYYNTDGLKAAVQTFADGHIDPSGVTMAMAASARAMGATITRHNRVTKVVRDGKLWRVISENDEYLAEHIVIAAGSYANQVGDWFGLKIPSVSCLHHYLVTDTVPEFVERETELPVMRDNSFGGYIRQEQKSGLIGIYEGHVCPTVWTEGAPWDAENPLFDADYDSIGDFLMVALDKMPMFADLGIKRVVRGAITHTPDGGMLLGPSGVPNVWLACGSSIGLAWGGGASKILAQWMTTGKTQVSTRSLDPRRYGNYANDEFILERTKDEFMRRHDTPLPGKQLNAMRPLKRHPLYDRLQAKGAQFAEIAGWERPRWFAHDSGLTDSHGWRRQPWHQQVADECRAISESAGVIDLCAFAQMRVTGKDAQAFLNRLSANRVSGQLGKVHLCHLLTPAGDFETEMTISCIADNDYFLGSAIARAEPDFAWLQQHIHSHEDVQLTNLSQTWGMLALSGPNSRKILQALTPASLENSAFPWLRAQPIQVAGHESVTMRVSFTGELGWEIHAPLDAIGHIYDALFTAGEDHGLRDIGSLALNACRMEKAYPASAELSSEVGIMEANMQAFLHTDGRDFIGRAATLQRLQQAPTSRLIYAEVLHSQIDCHGGEPILLDGQAVGLVTSGAYGHRTNKSLIFAYVNNQVGMTNDLQVQILQRTYPIQILTEAAWDAANGRQRQ